MQTYLYMMRMSARQRIIAAMCLYVANLPKKPYIGLSPQAEQAILYQHGAEAGACAQR